MSQSSHHTFARHFTNNNSSIYWKVNDQPLETLTIYNSKNGYYTLVKCFTYFSHTNNDWKYLNLAYDLIRINVKFDITTNGHLAKFNVFPISIHSPNSLPHYHMFKYIKPGFKYLSSYSQWKIERLGYGYDTDCREYESIESTWNECVYQCYQDTVKRDCQQDGIVLVDLFLRMDHLKNKTISNCTVQESVEKVTILRCIEQCKIECHYSYYSMTINTLSDVKYMNTTIFIRHNEMPDLDIRHIPEMPLMTLICNFGGLLGMWLGASFLNILGELWTSFRKVANSNRNLINIQAILNIKNAIIN